jgi:hypothetical protein
MYAGDVLLSHTVARVVPSALRRLTSVFGMGTGVSAALLPPASLVWPVRPGPFFDNRIRVSNRRLGSASQREGAEEVGVSRTAY